MVPIARRLREISPFGRDEMYPQNKLAQIIEKILDTYQDDKGINHIEGPNLPAREAVEEIVVDLLNVLFPGYYEKLEISREEVSLYIWERIVSIYHNLSREIAKSLKTIAEMEKKTDDELTTIAVQKTLAFLLRLPHVRKKLTGDVGAAYDGDPAAKSFDEIILCYPGLAAIAVYRVAHELYIWRSPSFPGSWLNLPTAKPVSTFTRAPISATIFLSTTARAW